MNKIFNEDNIKTLKRFKDDCLDLTLTSPPYDNLRDYKGFSFDINKLSSELYRTTKPGGIVVWVVGDAVVAGSETGTSFRQALRFIEVGFRLHDTMIYQKNNFANPSKGRYHQIFEYMFVFSKGKPKTFNPIKDRKNIYAGHAGSWGKNTTRKKDGSLEGDKKSSKIISDYGMRYNIWKYQTSATGQEDKVAYEHPAIFPIQLATDHILSWTNKGDLVYDPFMGSGTTAKASLELNRQYIGSEISTEYVELINKRLTNLLKSKEFFEL